jgi:hypothetical protein
MQTTLKCKHCGQEIEITEALTHQISEQAIKAAITKTKEESEQSVKQFQQAALEEKERNKKLQEEQLELMKQMRKMVQDRENEKLEMEKRIAAEEEKIRLDVRKKADEEHQLKDAEKDKRFQDTLKEVEDLKRKLQQGSQQTQGEALELLLEDMLKKEFPDDQIIEVKKGERGADITQVVVDKLGRECGTILWESKNAQWSDTWAKKLKEDQRAAKADLAVLVSAHLPKGTENFVYLEGIWITTPTLAVCLAYALRFDLVHLLHERLSAVGKNEKMEILYQYLKSTEFKHRIEAIVEAFDILQGDIEKEKRWFNLKWARQEKELRKIIDNTHGMYGELQAVTGRQLQEIKPLDVVTAEANPELF